jgi:hypothetical protein
MAALTWFTGLLLAGSSLVSCVPQAADTTVAASARTPDASGSADIASQFVSQLITNATQAEQDVQARVKRNLSCGQNPSLVVDLGYAMYRGYHNATTGLNYWKGSEHSSTPPSFRIVTSS